MQITQKKGGVILSYVQMVSNVLVKFVYTPFLLRSLGQNEYGLFSLVMSIVGYLAVLELGFGSTVTRYTVKFNSENDKESLFKLYGTLSVMYILMGITALVICCVLSYFTPELFSATMTDEETSKLQLMIFLCGINLLFTFPLQISASVLVAYERFIFKNGVNLIRTFLQPAILILLLYLVHIKSVGAIMVVTLFNLLTYLTYYIYAYRKLDFKFSIKNVEPKMIKGLLSFSVWMFLIIIFEHLQYNSGQFIIGLFQGADVIAIWGIAMIFILNYRSISTAITNVFLPYYLSETFKNNEEGVERNTYKMTRFQTVALFTILSNFILFGQIFIDLWAGESYHDAFKAALIVMTPMTLALLLDFCYLIQIATNKLKFRIATLYIGFVVAFVAVYLTEGITLTSYAIVMAVSIIVSQIICVLYYIHKNIKLNLSSLFKNIAMVSLLPTMVTVVVYLILYSFTDFIHSSVFSLIISAIVYNVMIVSLYWKFIFTQEEKAMIKNLFIR